MTLEEIVYKKYNELLRERRAVIVNGEAHDFFEYKRLTGFIQGATALMKEIDPYIKNPEDAGEHDGR